MWKDTSEEIGDYINNDVVPSKTFCSGTYFSPVFIPRGLQTDKILYKHHTMICKSFGTMFAFSGDTEW